MGSGNCPLDAIAYNSIMQRAVVDTSFWGAAVALGVDAYLTTLFRRPLWMPRAVIDEVMAQNPEAPGRVYPRQVRLAVALEDGRVQEWDPEQPYPRFGRGEAACLGVALQHRCHLLLNDRRPYQEALRLGIAAVSVPEVVGILAGRGTISAHTARVWLDALRDTVAEEMIDAVERILGREGQA